MIRIGLGFITAFIFGVAVFYGVFDLDAIISSSGSFPLSEIYAQATGSRAATFGLLLIVLLSIMICIIGTVTMVGRLWWTLARDNATPSARFFAKVDESLSCPVPATIFCALRTTGLGAIQLGSKVAFTVLVSSFITLTTVSYLLAILPNVLTRRSNIPRGPFWMPGALGYMVNITACILIVFFNVWLVLFPLRIPGHGISHELQLGHSRRPNHLDSSLVVRAWGSQLSRSKSFEALLGNLSFRN
ncbi:hypothetical protein BST61_g4829 [Cercospora zeina]